MPLDNREVDIARNIRLLEWLQAELVGAVASLLKATIRGSQEAILDALAGVIMTTYLLGRRLGLSYTRVDLRLEDKLRASLVEGHEVEQWYGDLSALLRYLENKR